MKEKLFIIMGNNTEVEHNSLLNPLILSKYAEVTEFGNFENGFDYYSLQDALRAAIKEEDKTVNIIINAHGNIDPKRGFYIAASETPNLLIPGKVLLDTITEVTGSKKVKIFCNSCLGEDLGKSVNENMLLITFSDSDKNSAFSHFLNPNHDSIFEKGKIEGLNIIDNLLRAYCYVGGKYNTSYIRIHFKYNGQVHTHKLTDYLEDFINSKNAYSLFLQGIFESDKPLENHVYSLLQQIENGKKAENFNSFSIVPYCIGYKDIPDDHEELKEFFKDHIYPIDLFLDLCKKMTDTTKDDEDEDVRPLIKIKRIEEKLKSLADLPDEPKLSEELEKLAETDNTDLLNYRNLLENKKGLLANLEEANTQLKDFPSLFNFFTPLNYLKNLALDQNIDIKEELTGLYTNHSLLQIIGAEYFISHIDETLP
jgi:hypothetical protein